MAGKFESEPCGRCGGSGHYSYCQSYGTTCFKCHGKGEVFTARGAVAQAYYVRLLSKTTLELQPGDKIRVLGIPGFSTDAWYGVKEVYPQSAERNGGAYSLNPDGSPNYHGYVIECDGYTLHAEAESLHRIAHSAEQKTPKMAAALEYQESLTKQGKERKRA